MNELQATLESLELRGDFYSEHQLDGLYLQINVNKIGRLRYPLTDTVVQSLISIAQPAKYGLGEQTILDKSIRKVWEIKPTKFQILKTGWKKGFEPLLKSIKDDLGLPKNTKLTASLHNMLVYEPGCFFKPHQDSEKIDNMIATMVVVLPSKHTGGALVVSHNGHQHSFDSDKQQALLQVFAFYADCRHEVKQLELGYRVALTFNLILENYSGEIACLVEQDFNKRVSAAVNRYFSTKSWLPNWYQNDKVPTKLVYILDHEYTEKGLNWQRLKNGDRLRVEALLKVADEQQLEAYLTLVDSHEIWDCYDDNDYYGSRRKYRYDDEEDDSEANYVLNSLIESDTKIEYWLDREGECKNFSSYHVKGCYVYATQTGENLTPYNSEYEGFMGNYGNTMDRWYKRAAVVMWRKQDAAKILFEIDPLTYIHRLYQPMHDAVPIGEIKDKLYAQLDELNDVMGSLVQQLEFHEQYAEILSFIAYLNEPMRASRIVLHFNCQLISAELVKCWTALSKTYGVEWLINVFSIFFEKAHQWKGLPDFYNLIVTFHQASLDKQALQFLFNYQLNQVTKAFEGQLITSRRYLESAEERHQIICEFIEVDLLIKDTEIHQKLMGLIISNQLALDVVKLVDMLNKYQVLSPQDKVNYGVDRLVDYVKVRLEKEKIIGVQAEDNWSIHIEYNCDCELCKVLEEFLLNTICQEKVWPIAQAKRNHVSDIIYNANIPVTTDTLAAGSPHKLILTKNKDMHLKIKQRYHQVCGAIERLRISFELY